MSEVKVNKISPRSGTDVTLGDSGDTITVPTGVTLDTSNSTVTLPDGTVTEAKIGSGAVTSVKLGSDVTQGITMADQWRLTADLTTDGDITSNLERVDNASYAKIGTGMSESSGIFTFPSTGLYLIRYTMVGEAITDDNVLGYIKTTQDNSSYANDALNYFSGDGGSTASSSSSTEYFFNVTNTSTHKVKFSVSSLGIGSLLIGSTSTNITCFTFIRLGDSI